MGEEFIKRIEILEILPCFTSPGRIRVEANAWMEGETGNPLADVIPVLFLKYPPSVARFNEQDGTLTLRLYDRMIGIFPSGTIGMQNTRDEAEAKQILEEIRGVLNEAHSSLVEKGRPSREALMQRINWTKISPFQIMKNLPNITHCHKCGEASCSSFATKLRSGEARISDCVILEGEKYEDKKKNLENLLGIVGES